MATDWLKDYVYGSDQEEELCDLFYEKNSLEDKKNKLLVKKNKEKKKELKNKKNSK